MKPNIYIAVLSLISLSLFQSCTKYSDPAPIEDQRLDTNYYCNDPMAVNYNWGFPGTPSDSVCIFPSDVLEGTYTLIDSSFDIDDSFLNAQTYSNARLDKVAKNYISLKNYCTDSLLLLLTVYLQISTDTIDGNEYNYCGTDTFSISGIKNNIDTTEFDLYKRAKDLSQGYSKLHFIQQ